MFSSPSSWQQQDKLLVLSVNTIFDRREKGISNSITGLGVMGWPMAANLRSKIDSNRELVICDVSEEAISRFQSALGNHGPIKVVSNGYEAFRAAVWSLTGYFGHIN
jgi:hypothetical protein